MLDYVDTNSRSDFESLNASHAAPTLGWDTAFSVSYSEINDAIRISKNSPATMDVKPSGPLKFGVTSKFGLWQMFPGGNGDSVHFLLPMKDLKASYVLQGKPGTVTCDQLTITVAVKLDIVPHTGPATHPDGTPLPAPAAGTKRHAIKLRTKGTGPSDPVASIVNVDYIKPLSDPQASTPIRTCFDNWVLTQIQVFEHIFAFVDLNDQIDHGDFAFCKPHTSSYAVCDTIDKSSGFLSVLSMTSADPKPVIQQVSTNAIPSGAGASFLIREKRFLVDMVQPGLLKMWPNLKAHMLELSKDERSLRMKPDTVVELPQVKSDGSYYTPKMTSFECKVVGNELVITTNTVVEVSLGIYGTCYSQTYYELFIDKNKKGKQIINYKQSRKPTIQKGHYSDSGIAILQEILTVIGIVLGILAIFLTDGAATIAVAAMLFVMLGHFIVTSLQDDALDAAPGLSEMVKNFVGPVIWTSKKMKLSSSGLHGCLQLGGDFS